MKISVSQKLLTLSQKLDHHIVLTYHFAPHELQYPKVNAYCLITERSTQETCVLKQV